MLRGVHQHTQEDTYIHSMKQYPQYIAPQHWIQMNTYDQTNTCRSFNIFAPNAPKCTPPPPSSPKSPPHTHLAARLMSHAAQTLLPEQYFYTQPYYNKAARAPRTTRKDRTAHPLPHLAFICRREAGLKPPFSARDPGTCAPLCAPPMTGFALQ